MTMTTMIVMMMLGRGRITADDYIGCRRLPGQPDDADNDADEGADGDDDAEDYSGSADDYIGCRRLPGQPGQAYRRTFIEFTQCRFAFGSR